MKKVFYVLMLWILAVCPVVIQAHPDLDVQLQLILTSQTAPGISKWLSAADKSGTPRVIALARQGDISSLTELGTRADSGKFLLVQDFYGNNIFHVAKNAETLQVLASLIRQHFGVESTETIRTLADQRNGLDETPLHAQISAGHTDTFRPLYAYTTLKYQNNRVQEQLARLRGMDEQIVSKNQAIYCQDIKTLASGHGQTLLQAAQGLAFQTPEMARLAERIQSRIPCLSL